MIKAKNESLAYGRSIDKNSGIGTGWEFQRASLQDLIEIRLDTSEGSGQLANIASSVYDDTWHFIAATVSNGTVKGYRDGILQYTDSYSHGEGFGNNDSQPLYIGGVNNYFNGSIDEVMIFNRTLSAEQILALYNNRTDIIVSQETNVGDNWSVCVTPNDGFEDGQELCSVNLTVVNSVSNSSSVNRSVSISRSS